MELVLDLNKRYTYADYLTWADEKVRELMNGFIKTMSPAPSSRHQVVFGNLFADLHRFIKKTKGNAKFFQRLSMFVFLKTEKRKTDK